MIMHSVLGALAFAGLIGAQFLAAIVLTGKPADLDPGGPEPRRDTDRFPQAPGELLRAARAMVLSWPDCEARDRAAVLIGAAHTRHPKRSPGC